VIVKLHGDDEGALTFAVADDGRGFDTASTKPGAGLVNMRDRLDALGGVVEVTSQPGAGTRISGSLPVPVRVEVAIPA
jgi:signal transduction histidine kinase